MLMILLISLVSVVVSQLSFLILGIWSLKNWWEIFHYKAACLYGQSEAEGSQERNLPMTSQLGVVWDDVRQTLLRVHGFCCDQLSVWHMPDPVLNSLCVFSHLIFTPSHNIGNMALFPFYRQGNRDSERLNNLPKVPQLVAGKAGTLTRSVHLRTHSK